MARRDAVRRVSYRDTLIDKYAKQFDIDPAWARAMLSQESGGDPNAQSNAGAVGLMQVLPGTAAQYLRKGESLTNPETNIRVGFNYFSDLLKKYKGDYDIATAAYNAGPGAVDKYGGIPPYSETRDYVSSIQERYRPTLQKLGDTADPYSLTRAAVNTGGADPYSLTPKAKPTPKAPKPSPSPLAKAAAGAFQSVPQGSPTPTPVGPIAQPTPPPPQAAPTPSPRPQPTVGPGPNAAQRVGSFVDDLRTGAGTLLRGGVEAANTLGGTLDYVLGAQERGMEGYEISAGNREWTPHGTDFVKAQYDPYNFASAVTHAVTPKQQGDTTAAESAVGLDKARNWATQSFSPGQRAGLMSTAAGLAATSPMAAAGINALAGDDSESLRGALFDFGFTTLNDPLTYETFGLDVLGKWGVEGLGNIFEKGGSWVLNALGNKVDKVLADPKAPANLRNFLAAAVPNPDVRVNMTPRGRAEVRMARNSEYYKAEEQSAIDRRLLQQYGDEISRGNVPDAVRQRLLQEPWRYGNDTMRRDAEALGYTPTPDDQELFKVPEGILNYDLRREYFPHTTQDLFTPDEITGYAGRAGLDQRPNLAGFEGEQTTTALPEDPLAAMQLRLEMGRTATRYRMTQKRIAQSTGLPIADHPEWSDHTGVGQDTRMADTVKPGREDQAATYFNGRMTESSDIAQRGITAVTQPISNFQRDLLINVSPFPHAKNISVLAYLAGGVQGLQRGLGYAMSGVPQKIADRLIHGGAAGAAFRDYKPSVVSRAIPWSAHGRSALDRIDMGMRAARLEQIDRKFPMLSEAEKMEMVDDDIGAYRQSPAFLKLFNMLGAEFPQWHGYIVPTAVSRAVLKNPQRIEAMIRAEQGMNYDAANSGYYVSMGGPVDEFNQLLSVPGELASGERPKYLTSPSLAGPFAAYVANQSSGNQPDNFDPLGNLGKTVGESVPGGQYIIDPLLNPYNSKAPLGERFASELLAMPIRSTSSQTPGTYEAAIRNIMVQYHVDRMTAEHLLRQQHKMVNRYGPH